MQSYYNYLKQPELLRKSKFLNSHEALKYGNIEPSTYIPYKDYQVQSLKPKDEQESKLFDLMAVWFTINEMNLYLDTHPKDPEAIELLMESIKKYDDLKVEYVLKYHPLCLTLGDYTKTPFVWLDKWPWEGDYK